MNIRQKLVELGIVLVACLVVSVLYTIPWYPNKASIPTVYKGDAEFFAKIDASMWTYMLAWGAKHPSRFYDAPVLLPVNDPLVANDPRLTEGIWSIPLFRLLPPVLAWGITLWLALTLTAAGCYYAGKIFTGSCWGGAALSVLFSFGMFRANHVCHIEGIFVPFLALSFTGMAKFLEMPKKLTMVGFALALTAAVIEYSYIAVPLGIALPIAFAYGVWRRKIPYKQAVQTLLIAVALTALILLPVALKYAEFHQSLGVKRHIMHVDSCSADLFAWITGPTGRILPPFGGAFEHNFVDPQLFPGFILLFAGMAGILMLWRKSPELVFIGVFAFLLSFGTMRFLLWQMGAPHIPWRMPYELLYDYLLPFKAIRAPARFGVLTHLVLAFAGAMVVVRMSSWRKGRILAVILLAVSFVEARNGMHAVRILPERAGASAYKWLAAQSGDFAVLEAPLGLTTVRERHLAEAESMLMALVHNRRTPNGTLAADIPWHDSISVNIANPEHSEAKRLMQALGIRYVVARDANIAEQYTKAGYKCVYGSGSSSSVFEVEQPQSVVESPMELVGRLDGDEFYRQARSGGKPESANLRAPFWLALRSGTRFEMPVTIRNTGKNTWAGNSHVYGKGFTGDVFVGIRRWKCERDGHLDFAKGPRGEILGAAGALPCNLFPGESTDVIIMGIAPVVPGNYVAEIDVGIKGVGWVGPADNPPVTVQVKIQ